MPSPVDPHEHPRSCQRTSVTPSSSPRSRSRTASTCSTVPSWRSSEPRGRGGAVRCRGRPGHVHPVVATVDRQPAGPRGRGRSRHAVPKADRRDQGEPLVCRAPSRRWRPHGPPPAPTSPRRPRSAGHNRTPPDPGRRRPAGGRCRQRPAARLPGAGAQLEHRTRRAGREGLCRPLRLGDHPGQRARAPGRRRRCTLAEVHLLRLHGDGVHVAQYPGARAGQRSEDAARPELHRDPRPGVRHLGHGVLPRALARAAHHHQVAVAHLERDRAPPPRGRSASRRGSPNETIATIVSWVLPRPMVSPCQATLSRPSR